MLIDFTVENYRSIKEPVTLSFIADTRGPGKARQGTGKRLGVKTDEEIAPGYPVEGRGFALLPVVGIFGANASGKSNVLRAFQDFIDLIQTGAGDHRANLRALTPFELDQATSSQPTQFFLRLAAQDGCVYDYRLCANKTQVINEELGYLPPTAKRRRLLFSRVWSNEHRYYDWKNGPDFRGPQTLLEAQIQPFQPFIYTLLTQLDVKVISPIAEWLTTVWPMIEVGDEQLDLHLASKGAHQNHTMKSVCLGFIKAFDTGVDDINIRRIDDGDGAGDSDEFEVHVVHQAPHGPVTWPLTEESTGTQRLFGLAPQLGAVLGTGGLLIVDELGSNIHPYITRRIVRLFQNPATNLRGAQLLFTSHDNTLQRGQLLRRDQVWLTQKLRDSSTELYSASDFRVRNDMPLDRAYLDGRLGAVPILPDEDDVSGTLELCRD